MLDNNSGFCQCKQNGLKRKVNKRGICKLCGLQLETVYVNYLKSAFREKDKYRREMKQQEPRDKSKYNRKKEKDKTRKIIDNDLGEI